MTATWIVLSLALAGGFFWLFRRRGQGTALPREVLLGRAFGRLLDGERQHVVEEMRRLYQQSGQDVGVGLALGTLFRHMGKHQMAIRMHRGLAGRTGLEPSLHALILTELSADYLGSGLLERARKANESSAELKGDDALNVRYGERILIRLKDWDAAIHRLRQFAKTSGRNMDERIALLHYEQAQDQLGLDEPQAALAALKKAISIHTECVPAQLGLAKYHRENGNPGKAATLMKKRQEVFRGYEWLALKEWLAIGMAIDDHSTFVLQAETRLADEPEDWRSRSVYAGFLMETGRMDEAAEQLILAIASSPQTLLLHQRMWSLMLRGEQPLKLIERYREKVRGELVFSNPYECAGCYFHSERLLWRCPSCYRVGSFRERKI